MKSATGSTVKDVPSSRLFAHSSHGCAWSASERDCASSAVRGRSCDAVKRLEICEGGGSYSPNRTGGWVGDAGCSSIPSVAFQRYLLRHRAQQVGCSFGFWCRDGMSAFAVRSYYFVPWLMTPLDVRWADRDIRPDKVAALGGDRQSSRQLARVSTVMEIRLDALGRCFARRPRGC